MKPPERIHALKGRDVAVVAGGETLRGRLADVQGDCLILHSDDFGVEVTVAVVRWPLVAAVISKEEPDFGGAVVTQEAGGLRCADCGESLADFDALQVHRLNRHP
jgi:hypothetical protein